MRGAARSDCAKRPKHFQAHRRISSSRLRRRTRIRSDLCRVPRHLTHLISRQTPIVGALLCRSHFCARYDEPGRPDTATVTCHEPRKATHVLDRDARARRNDGRVVAPRAAAVRGRDGARLFARPNCQSPGADRHESSRRHAPHPRLVHHRCRHFFHGDNSNYWRGDCDPYREPSHLHQACAGSDRGSEPSVDQQDCWCRIERSPTIQQRTNGSGRRLAHGHPALTVVGRPGIDIDLLAPGSDTDRYCLSGL